MTTQAVTLHLPEDIYRRLQLMAQATSRRLEDVAFQAIQGNLPPLTDDLPTEWCDELASLEKLSDEALWAITRESLPAEQWDRHQQLLERNQADTLIHIEQEELAHLRAVTDLFIFRRSYSLALLKWRGYTLPISEPLAIYTKRIVKFP